ncbi:MAG: SAM-dependent methyltransferase, partial [Candidatus Heimdallarchaeota archaeon]
KGKAIRFDDEKTILDSKTKLKNTVSFEWIHTISSIINALLNVGLQIEFIHEFPFCFFNFHPNMEKREDGYWHFTNELFNVPMIFSLKAKKPIK